MVGVGELKDEEVEFGVGIVGIRVVIVVGGGGGGGGRWWGVDGGSAEAETAHLNLLLLLLRSADDETGEIGITVALCVGAKVHLGLLLFLQIK